MSYTENFVISWSDLLYSHTYTLNDTQFYDSCRPENADTLRRRLSSCADDIISWCQSRRLQLNTSKTDVTWFGTQSKLATLNNGLFIANRCVQHSTVNCCPQPRSSS